MNKVKVVVFDEKKKTRIADYKDITLNPNQVLVKVKAAGLCGSDMHRFLSDKDPRKYLDNYVLGHEISGVVVSSFDNDLLNKRVAIKPLIFCKECESCRVGGSRLCENLSSYGKDLQGGFAEYISVFKENVRVLPNNVSFEEGALIDTAAVAVHMFQLASEKGRFENVLIVGDGALALCCARVFQYYNISVSLVGRNQYNLKVAKKYGCDVFDLKDMEYGFENHFDVVVETVGRSQYDTLKLAIDKCRRSGVIVVGGVFGEEYEGGIGLRELFYKQIIMQGANSYSYWNGKDEFDIALNIVSQFDFKKIVTHRVKLLNFADGLSLMKDKKKNKTIKVIFNP